MSEIPEKPPISDSDDFGALTTDDTTWGMLAHVSYLLTFVIGVSCIAPLIIWVVKKETSPFVEDQAKEALNFQLSTLLVSLVLAATCLGAQLVLVVVIMAIVYSITAAVAANRGERYRYPYTFRLIT